MKYSILVTALLLHSAAAIAAPSVPENVVFKPTFLTGHDSLTAGTGFVAKLQGRYLFFTAHHLFGPAAGLERDLSPAEAIEFAAALAATSMHDPKQVILSTRMLLIASAKAFNDKDAGSDVASFELPNYQGAALDMALKNPVIGDRVFLLGRPRGEETLRMIPAKVVRSSPAMLDYEFEVAGINLAGTSGAPILNEAGDVVGINVGGVSIRGKQMGFANPVSSFSTKVRQAIEAR
jgi:Trypsin-like peptidase domain